MPLPKLETRGGNPFPFSHTAYIAGSLGAFEVGQHQDVKQLGAGSGTEGFEALVELLFDLLQVHGIGTLAPISDSPRLGAQGFSRLGGGTWWP